jgi:hypothetical protein
LSPIADRQELERNPIRKQKLALLDAATADELCAIIRSSMTTESASRSWKSSGLGFARRVTIETILLP